MDRVKKYIFITAGLIAFALGAVGVVLPILPTTPFLLVASFCFAKGSDKFNNWFINTKIYKKRDRTVKIYDLYIKNMVKLH